LDVAELVLDETDRNEYLNVCAGLAVLSGIAASDAICCTRLAVAIEVMTTAEQQTCSSTRHPMASSSLTISCACST